MSEVGTQQRTWITRAVRFRTGSVTADALRLECPHCHEKSYVGPKWPFLEYKTRPCPYCFATSKIPTR